MAHTTNAKIPRLRAQAVDMVRSGKTATEVARHFGYTKGAVSKWCKKYPQNGTWVFPTESVRPHRHPNELPRKTARTIVAYNMKNKRCSEIIHQHLQNDGIVASLNSVKRKLDDVGLIRKRSPWKRLHLSTKPPNALKPRNLLMIDTIHLLVAKLKMYMHIQ